MQQKIDEKFRKEQEAKMEIWKKIATGRYKGKESSIVKDSIEYEKTRIEYEKAKINYDKSAAKTKQVTQQFKNALKLIANTSGKPTFWREDK